MSSKLAIFISYAHADQAVARIIAERLSAEGVRVWIDEGELRVGDSLIERISAALDDVHFVVAIVSETSVQSQWCRKELSLAMTGGLRRAGVRVLPLRLGQAEMPPALMDALYLQLNPEDPGDVVPRLVADARSHQAEHESAAVQAVQLPVREEESVPLTKLHDPMLGQAVSAGFPPTSHERRSGVVKWFNADKGYGFLQDDAGTDYFIHYSWIVSDGYRTLVERQRVTFVPGRGQKGLVALAILPD